MQTSNGRRIDGGRRLTLAAARETLTGIDGPMVAPVADRRSGANVGRSSGNLSDGQTGDLTPGRNGRAADHRDHREIMRHTARFVWFILQLMGRKVRAIGYTVQCIWIYTAGSSKANKR